MAVKHFGIVLKTFFPYLHKISVLSRTYGKLNLVVRQPKITTVFSPGILVAFVPIKKNFDATVVVGSLEIIMVPFLKNDKDIYWVHHLLEICYYFAPLASPCVEIFYLLKHCFVLTEQASLFGQSFERVKKLCLLKLFALLGFHLDKALVPFIFLLEEVLTVSLDSSDMKKVRSLQPLLTNVSDAVAKQADEWLLRCVYTHPCITQFKTISFFDKV